MAQSEDDKVKIELELPKDEVSVDPTPHISERAKQVEKAEEKIKEKTKEVQEKEEELKDKEDKLKKAAKKLKEEKESDEESTVGGYEPAEILKAPLEAVKPKDKRPPNTSQKAIIILGFVLILVAIVLWPLFNFGVFIGAAIIGACVIAFGALIRI